MGNVNIEALAAVDDLIGGRLILLRLLLVLLLGTFGDDELMTALMNDTRAH